jgi:hypothetical protein
LLSKSAADTNTQPPGGVGPKALPIIAPIFEHENSNDLLPHEMLEK